MTDAEGKEDVDAPQETIHHAEEEPEQEDKEATNANQKMKYGSFTALCLDVSNPSFRLKLPEDKKKKDEPKEKEKLLELNKEGLHNEGNFHPIQHHSITITIPFLWNSTTIQRTFRA